MTKSAYIAVLACILYGCALEPSVPEPPLFIQGTHDVVGRTKPQIHVAARNWLALTFQDAKQVIEVDDREAGRIIGRGAVEVSSIGIVSPVRFTVMIESKDGRLRTTYQDFEIRGSYTGQWAPVRSDGMNNYPEKVTARLKELDASLVKYVSSSASDDSW
jgi:hypothetical protein